MINTYYADKTNATWKWLHTLSLKEAQQLFMDDDPTPITQYWTFILENDNTRNFYINACDTSKQY